MAVTPAVPRQRPLPFLSRPAPPRPELAESAVPPPAPTVGSAPRAGVAPPTRLIWQRRYGQWLCASDLAVTSAAVVMAELVHAENQTGATGDEFVQYPVAAAVVVAGWIGMLALYRSRSPWVIGAGTEEFRRVLAATVSLFGAMAVVATLSGVEVPRGCVATALLLGLFGLYAGRCFARRLVAAQRSRGRMLTGVLACGDLESIAALASSFARRPQYGYVVVGACTSAADIGTLDVAGVGAVPVFGHGGDIRAAVTASGADTIALTSAGHLDPQRIRDLSWQLDEMDIDLLVSPGMVDITRPRLNVRLIADMPLIQLTKPQYHGAKRFQKRAFDICFALTALVVAAPVMLTVGLAVKLTSPGPIFYLSERIGLEGRAFRMIKFRTMMADADQRLDELVALNDVSGGVLFKMRHDPRVTPVGRLIRRYSLDELPQFLNVLRGDMSVVGPRPPLPSEASCYDSKVRRRLLVRPGITGLWQVSGRSDLCWEDSVRLDLFYIENWSTVADLVIIAKTVKAVLNGAGAY